METTLHWDTLTFYEDTYIELDSSLLLPEWPEFLIRRIAPVKSWNWMVKSIPPSDFEFLPDHCDELGMLATVPIVTRLAALASWTRVDGTCWPTVWLDWTIFMMPDSLGDLGGDIVKKKTKKNQQSVRFFLTISPPKSTNLWNGCEHLHMQLFFLGSFGGAKSNTYVVCHPSGRSRGRCRRRKRPFGQ